MLKDLLAIPLLLVYNVGFITTCGRRGPSPDRTKPDITCRPDISAYADPFQINTKVFWDERTIVANDNRDGGIKPTRTGQSPGSLFSENVTRIFYHARDKSGNYASCHFDIKVKVLRCKPWGDIQDGWKICHVSHDMRLGSVCRFGCYSGYKLVGASKTVCLESTKWDTATKPYCQKTTCDELSPTSGQHDIVDIVCTDKNYYRSKCTYNCMKGYSILPGNSKIRVCTEFRKWRGMLPKCVDTEPPVYSSCPYVRVVYAERSKTTGRVWWDDPTAIDNSGTIISMRLSGPPSGSELEIGEHTVKYIAFDATNNTAVCEFKVIVKQIKCHTIYPLPYTSVVCPKGRIYGSACQFVCDNGTSLNGLAYVQCEKTDSDVPYGAWTFKNNQPYCERQNKCPALRAPDNGALACDTWLYGKYCQMLCQKGYVVMDDPQTSFDEVHIHKTLLVCGDSGSWYIPGDLPNCQEVDESLFLLIKIQVDYLYYDGVCDENDNVLRTNFIKAFTSATGLSCQHPACSLSNVKITCGYSSAITRRRRQGTSGIRFVASVEISAGQSSAETVKIRSAIKTSLNVAKQGGDLDIDINGTLSKPSVIEVKQPKVFCNEGSSQNKKTLQCVKCNVGYFHDLANDVCSPCIRGYYQDTPKQTVCKRCPVGTTTETKGAYAKSQCKEACPPGFYSATGAIPCSACDLGSYSETYGNTVCTHCQGSQVTLKSGATSRSQCKEFDMTFTLLNESEVFHVFSMPFTMHIQNAFILTFFVKCQQCDNIVSILREDGQPIVSVNGTKNLQVELFGDSYETNETIEDSMMWNQITIIKNGSEFTTRLNDREILQQRKMFTAAMSTDAFNLTIGGDKFVGSFSQMNMWSDIDAFTSKKTSTCFTMHHGDLINWRQVSEFDGSFIFTDSICDVENSCLSTPCQSGASCTDTIGGFFCTCASGYTGKTCEINIDDCYENACDNNATCIDGDYEYTCLCEYGFTGDLCEIHFVDGGWTEWELSGACSVTCGSGEQQRSRVCENPLPVNGGKHCNGDSSELILCATNIECVNDCATDPTHIENGSMNCVWTDNQTRVCEPSCDVGFEFDSDMYVHTSGIICGPETGYTWNINNADNPYSRLPSCTPKIMALKNKINYTAKYPTLSTLPSDVKSKIKEKVNGNVKEIGCVVTGRCELDDIYVFVSDESSANSTDHKYVMFSVELTCVIVADMDECYDHLAGAVATLNKSIEHLEFTILHDGIYHDVGLNSSSLSGTSVCSSGSVPVWQYCVSCGKGTYALNDYCESCSLGFYQDMEGQTTCKKCPEGFVTAGIMSRTIDDCNVYRSTDISTNKWLVIGTVIGSSVVAVAFFVAATVAIRKSKLTATIIHKKQKRRKYKVKAVMHMSTVKHAHVKYQMKDMETSNANTDDEKSVLEMKGGECSNTPVCTDASAYSD